MAWLILPKEDFGGDGWGMLGMPFGVCAWVYLVVLMLTLVLTMTLSVTLVLFNFTSESISKLSDNPNANHNHTPYCYSSQFCMKKAPLSLTPQNRESCRVSKLCTPALQGLRSELVYMVAKLDDC